ncbi:MAG: hypothetical protein JRH08_11195 [Deltaproteobacteria bacterium]|nr:hypothetical protein [Deltaproteobacteria bacterium]MBW1929326.1 hypothetical protein [Deltaproteobacteria bacterium]MBW2025140.1 hypothetical protein [Deltaproteobacteria bacterium]MBW2126239.1 hypothetical protein [Deltaproteobacteria bacterium]RLB14063.1 MAG: hypothetical protein DRG63_09125 [Deltaproteobacteria bacterium]
MGTILNNDINTLMPNSTRDREGLELITCKRQPGNLRISKYACALRYRKSLNMEQEIPDDEFGMVLKHGLEICRGCPRGRRYAEILLAEDKPSHGRGKNKRRGQGRYQAYSREVPVQAIKKKMRKRQKSATLSPD